MPRVAVRRAPVAREDVDVGDADEERTAPSRSRSAAVIWSRSRESSLSTENQGRPVRSRWFPSPSGTAPRNAATSARTGRCEVREETALQHRLAREGCEVGTVVRDGAAHARSMTEDGGQTILRSESRFRS